MKKRILFVLGLCCLLLGLVSCQPGSTQAKSEQVELPITDLTASTPTLEPRFATNIEEIASQWEGPLADQGFVPGYSGKVLLHYEFKFDGTWIAALKPSYFKNPATAPISGKVWFENTTAYIETTKNKYVYPVCTEIGTYEIKLLDQGNIVFLDIEDPCEYRRRSMMGKYFPIP